MKIDSYICNESLKRNFTNLYRYIKTLTFLKSLYLADTISKQQYDD